jgi:hypothetical protein
MTGQSTQKTLAIADKAITLPKMADLAALSLIGNNTASSATPIALTAAQTMALIGAAGLAYANVFTKEQKIDNSPVTLTGVISCTPPYELVTTLIGSGTLFLSEVKAGDYLYNHGGSYGGRVLSVETNTSLTFATGTYVFDGEAIQNYKPAIFISGLTPTAPTLAVYRTGHVGFGTFPSPGTTVSIDFASTLRANRYDVMDGYGNTVVLWANQSVGGHSGDIIYQLSAGEIGVYNSSSNIGQAGFFIHSVGLSVVQRLINETTGTNAIVNGNELRAISSGTVAAGFGIGQLFSLETATADTIQSAGRIFVVSIDPANATRKYALVGTAFDASGEREGWRVEASGSAVKLGLFGGTPALQQILSAYTTDPESSAYSGIDNAQAGSVYAQLADLNALRVAYDNLRAAHDDLRTKLKTSTIVA